MVKSLAIQVGRKMEFVTLFPLSFCHLSFRAVSITGRARMSSRVVLTTWCFSPRSLKMPSWKISKRDTWTTTSLYPWSPADQITRGWIVTLLSADHLALHVVKAVWSLTEGWSEVMSSSFVYVSQQLAQTQFLILNDT